MPSQPAGPTGHLNRSFQVHPTRRCNLRCLHCYSDSGPEVDAALDIDVLRRAVDDAAREGYTVLGVSGGEPLLYRSLRDLLLAARQAGMRTTVTTNGMLLRGKRLEMLPDALDLLAISLDGPPAEHNRMRNSPRAFEQMAANLDELRATGIPFGFIFTLTRHNVNDLDWVARFALEAGAALLQIHPLEEAGRAHRALHGSAPDGTELTFAFLEVLRIQAAVGNRLRLHLDIVDRDLIRSQPERVYAGDAIDTGSPATPLAGLVSPLILETDGTLVPLQYGFPRPFALGNLHQHPLPELAARWRQERYPRFRELCQRTYTTSLSTPTDLPFFNWYEAVSREGREMVAV